MVDAPAAEDGMRTDGNTPSAEDKMGKEDEDRMGKEDVFKLMTKDLSHFSSELHQKITFASSFVANFLLDSSGRTDSSEKDAANGEQEIDTFEIIAKKNEKDDDIMAKILALSEDKLNFLEPPCKTLDDNFNYEKLAPFALEMLKQDERLNKMRYQLVPKLVQEDQFWNNYFSRVHIIKMGGNQEEAPSCKGEQKEAASCKKELEEVPSREEVLEELDGFQIIDAEEVESPVAVE